ncbi:MULTISPECIES: immunity 26/phosphotriesterase HocA family protein [Pectobacterium]|uniref:immunity 26/phosphotriesterase HocA family protein n=1 Tax=Pectobacterium TaxID=122277 RepID=UPI001F11DDC0|nr:MULTISPECIES: immunity 26/phosphotriesterase HocA family protein [Pectobacterium]
MRAFWGDIAPDFRRLSRTATPPLPIIPLGTALKMKPIDQINSWMQEALRPYFGLEPLSSEWDILTVRDDYFICFDGDTIRKRITATVLNYQEDDVIIHTRGREVILPRTTRGKEKKLTYTSVSSVKADGVVFSAGVRTLNSGNYGYINASNYRNSIRLPLPECRHLVSKEELVDWLQSYPERVPTDYADKLERLMRMKNQQHKTVPGDIFRVEIDLHTDGYVLVIGNLRQMQKDALFAEHSIWHDVMTMPLFVRPYLFRTTVRNPALSEIVASPLSEKCWIVMDDAFLRGNYEFVGSKILAEEDILFPVGYGSSISAQKSDYRLSWGPCSVNKASQDTVFRAGRSYMNNGAYSSVSAECFADSGFPHYDKTLLNPEHREAWEQVLAEFDLPPDTTYDAFAQYVGGMTRAAYLTYVADNKAYQRKGRAKNKA